jgi:hypothetical protein
VAPSKPKPAEPTSAGLSSFLDKVISALKKTGGAPQKPKPTLQLPSLNCEDDDTPPMPSVSRSGSVPFPSMPERGVSPPRFGENLFDTANLIDDSEVIQILQGLDQVN